MENILEIAQNVGMLIAGCAIAFVTCKKEINKYFSKQKTRVTENLPKQSAIDIKITERMDYIKELLGADIIQVYEFHNGEHYADGRSAMKVSCTYETVRAGIPSIRSKCQQIPIACIPKFVKRILDDGCYICEDLENLKDSCPATYEFKKNNGIKAFVDYAIRNNKGQVIGFVAAVWTSDKKKFNLDQREMEKLAFFVEETLSCMINND